MNFLSIYSRIFTSSHRRFLQNTAKNCLLKRRDDHLTYGKHFCKLLERIILHWITWVLKSRDLHGTTQTGFRPHLSAQDNLALIHHDLFSETPKKTLKVLLTVDTKNALIPFPTKQPCARQNTSNWETRPPASFTTSS